MKKIILLLTTMVIVSSFFVGCNNLDRDRDVVSNIEITDGQEYLDRNNVQIVNNEQLSLSFTGTIYDFGDERFLILKVENKTSKDISVKIQSSTTDEKEQEAFYTQDKIASNKSASKGIIFKDKTDFEKSSGDIVIFESNSGNVLGTYKYDVKIVEKE